MKQKIVQDKDITGHDLRLTQIPDFEEMKKKFEKSSSIFKISERIVLAILRGEENG